MELESSTTVLAKAPITSGLRPCYNIAATYRYIKAKIKNVPFWRCVIH